MRDIGASLRATLERQRRAYLASPFPAFGERRADLLTLRTFIRDNAQDLYAAIAADYGTRSEVETRLLEIFPTIDGVGHALRHLARWMRRQSRGIDPLLFPGARNDVLPQPLGVVGVIVPWNFPVNLSLMPLISILAAGNRAMVKMSENSRHLAWLLIDRMPAYFPTDKLAFFDESGGVGIEFSRLPFDHLLFTGSGQTGRAVMAAAAQSLCPVTLELGGKAPAIVCDDFPLRTAVERIMYVKCLNAGQICTTVDYAWVPDGKLEAFVQHAQSIVPARYPTLGTADYTSIIDQRAFSRLKAALEEARARGATLIPLIPGPAWDDGSRKINPHLVIDAPEDCALLQREIFGPILPLRRYTALDQVIRSINDGDRPLALYPFSNDRRTIRLLLDRVMSGGVSVNDALMHVGQHDLPFGGVGASGMGHYHGREGFETFSKMRPVFRQGPVSAVRALFQPPYGVRARRFVSLLFRLKG